MSAPADPDGDNGLVIESFYARGVVRHGFKYDVNKL